MLFIQSLNTYYEKQKRSSEYARLRTGDMFRKIDLSKIKECEVFAQLLHLRYDADGGVSQAKPYSETYKIRNPLLMDRIVDFLMDNVSNLTSSRSISDTLRTCLVSI